MFEILGCGLYYEHKRYICTPERVENTVICFYSNYPFLFSLILLKTSLNSLTEIAEGEGIVIVVAVNTLDKYSQQLLQTEPVFP